MQEISHQQEAKETTSKACQEKNNCQSQAVLPTKQSFKSWKVNFWFKGEKKLSFQTPAKRISGRTLLQKGNWTSNKEIIYKKQQWGNKIIIWKIKLVSLNKNWW